MPSSRRPPRWRSRTNTGPNGYLDAGAPRAGAVKAFTKEDLDTGGYKIITTIDKSKQDLMQSIGDTRLDDTHESCKSAA